MSHKKYAKLKWVKYNKWRYLEQLLVKHHMISKEQGPNTEPTQTMGITNSNVRQQYHCLRRPQGVLNAFNWRQIFALDYFIVKTQILFSSHGAFLTNTMHRHGETSTLHFVNDCF